eukprot:scaffold86597_cov60-Attheya_sp.AAC.6
MGPGASLFPAAAGKYTFSCAGQIDRGRASGVNTVLCRPVQASGTNLRRLEWWKFTFDGTARDGKARDSAYLGTINKYLRKIRTLYLLRKSYVGSSTSI